MQQRKRKDCRIAQSVVGTLAPSNPCPCSKIVAAVAAAATAAVEGFEARRRNSRTRVALITSYIPQIIVYVYLRRSIIWKLYTHSYTSSTPHSRMHRNCVILGSGFELEEETTCKS